jgi:hypothetical protein
MIVHFLNLAPAPWQFIIGGSGDAPTPIPTGLSVHTLTPPPDTFLVFGPDDGFAEQLPRAFTANEDNTTAAIVILPDGSSTSIITPPEEQEAA